jgi:hypothetical protein
MQQESVAERRVAWGAKAIPWKAVDTGSGRNVMWSYALDGLTYFSFPFDPQEPGPVTTIRAQNWLNRHHLIPVR